MSELQKAQLTAMDIGDLSQKVAVITGSSSGLGRAMAIAFARAGALIVLADLSPHFPKRPARLSSEGSAEEQLSTLELIGSAHSNVSDRPSAIFVECDVTSAVSVHRAVGRAVETYGRLDIMVNNAGISAGATSRGKLHQQPDEILERDFAVNVRGVWNGIKASVTQFLKQIPHSSGDRGWIINTGSIGAMIGAAGLSSYCASKGAVVQMTKSAALDYAHDKIHVNCICPGYTDTPILDHMRLQLGPDHAKVEEAKMAALHPWGRLAKPSEIANMAVFLAGPGAAFCTGQVFVVDGGYTAW